MTCGRPIPGPNVDLLGVATQRMPMRLDTPACGVLLARESAAILLETLRRASSALTAIADGDDGVIEPSEDAAA